MTASPATTTAHAGGAGGEARVRTRREWVVLFGGVLVVAVLCLAAGRWQWHRYESRAAAVEVVRTNYEATPVALADLLPTAGAVVAADTVWRPVTMTGRYLTESTVLLRNRPVDSTAGFHVLVPFQVDSPAVTVVVDRGFVPIGADSSAPAAFPDPPAGDVTVVARLREQERPSDRGAPAGQVQSIENAQVLTAGGLDPALATVDGYVALVAEDPAPSAGLRALQAPDTSLGSHLSYAFQWCVFAAGAIGGFFVLLRRERREADARADDATGAGAALPEGTAPEVAAWISGQRPAPRRRTSDEDAEDAEIDAANG